MTRQFLLMLCLASAVGVTSAAIAQDEDAADMEAKVEVADVDVPTSGKFRFQLRDGTEFTGFMTDKAAIDLLLAGSELKVPMPLVESIRFDERELTRLRMQLNNGDSLSGQIMPGQLDVMAEWGTLKINSQSLSQVTRMNTSAKEPSAPPQTGTARPTTRGNVVVPASPPRQSSN